MANSNQVFFSVIIPCYNAATTIDRCLNSCLAQTCRDFEVIVIDDASTDMSSEMVRARQPEFAAVAIKLELITLSENLGQAAARNLGWEKASGAFIAFLDADDFWHCCKLATVRHFLQMNPTLSLLAHRYTERHGHEWQRQTEPSAFILKPVSFRRLLFKNVAACPCWVVRASLDERFDPQMRFSEDRDLWVRVAHRHRCAILHGPPLTCLGRPQHSTGGISSQKLRLRSGEIRVYLHAARLEPALLPMLPMLFLYSLLKTIRRELLLWLRVDGGQY